MLALALTQKRGPEDIPLMAKATARERILLLQDPDSEEDKVLAEMGQALPPIMAANIAAALKRRGEDELAEQVMLLLRPPQPKPSSPPLPPELIKAVVEALVAAGQGQLAGVFVQFVMGQATQGNGGAPPAPSAAPSEVQPGQAPPPSGMIGAMPPPGAAMTEGAPIAPVAGA